MKISFCWLKDLIDIPFSVEQMSEKLTDLGFPVEGVHYIGVQSSGVVAAKILNVEKHPNADRLRLATVTDGTLERLVVCGAPNIEVGQVVPLALPGATLPGGVKIIVSKIRGVESHGMLCSERELGISDRHEGIMMLSARSVLGADVRTILGEGDIVFDVDVTPNRPDMLSHVGVARELAALTGQKLKSQKNLTVSSAQSNASVNIEIADHLSCSRYIGHVIENVRVEMSPQWLQERLLRCGLRPINNVVDITNYVLLEWGHPLHAFDLNKISGKSIVVRKAYDKETIVALDEKTYSLSPDMLVIADSLSPIAIAGVMGGKDSGVGNQTKNILLESAVFNQTSIRLTSKSLSLKSESSTRFEKGTNFATAENASLRALQLIQEICGGRIVSSIDVFPVKETIDPIYLSSQGISRILGIDIDSELVERFLAGLGYRIEKTEKGWNCTPPIHRKDILEEVDIVEDIARLYGYNQIPSQSPSLSPGNIDEAQLSVDHSSIEWTLRAMGLNQTITSSFTSVDAARRCGGHVEQLVELLNPISQEETVMRPSLLPNLLKAAQFNVRRQRPSVALFEIGKKFSHIKGVPIESEVVGLVKLGLDREKSWNEAEKRVDYYLLKGMFEELNRKFSTKYEFSYSDLPSFLHPYQSFRLMHEKKEVGWAGVVHPDLAASFDLPSCCVAAEFSSALFRKTCLKAQPISEHPFVERDLAMQIPITVQWDDIARCVISVAGNLLRSVRPFDLYQGDKIAIGKKSLAFRLTLQSQDKTLTDIDVTGVVDRITSALKESCGAELRR